MAAYSYLTAITTEENRTFRFGAFSAMLSVIPFIGNLAAPTLMKSFNYAQLFGMMISVHILGLVYFLRLEEPEEKFVDNGHDNLGMDDQIKTESLKEKSITSTEELDKVERDSKNYILEFFDLAYAVQCISVVMKKRENVLKSLLIFLLASYYFSYSVTLCEDGVLFFFQRKVLNWDVDTYVYNFAYRIFCGTVGTIIMTEVFGKYLKVPDIFLALISIVLSIVSKFVYYSSDTTLKFFIGSTIDAAEAVRNLVIRSIVTQVITADETSTIFSLMGILEAVGQFIFSFIYPKVYQYLLPIDNVKLIFMFSASLLTLVLILLW
jgi:Na+/melibiose symporter-like transporter